MRTLSLLLLGMLFTSLRADDDPSKVLPTGEKSTDGRLGKLTTLNDYFPFTPPTSKEGWTRRAQEVREQVLVATGLWPMPEKTPLNPVVHSKIEREGYTVEKVYFASMPGHYVTGNLYRPTQKADGKRPAVLCPHGHWANGRFYDAGEKAGQEQIKIKAEERIEGARYPLQARCQQLAKMGFVVLFYDMVGYADSTAIKHREGFTDAEAELRLQNVMGLQTWNTIRALDFLTALDDVDPKRVGVTGASGGGTQTFILGAIDDRPAVAFPAVMVSTAMQGGCVCENCSYLRVGTGNVELAGLFAPKPLGMSGAKDWTIDIEKKGLPELKKLYVLLGHEDRVMARCYPEFGHNYNQVARELMYGWFNEHLLGKKEPVKETPFVPVPPKELEVFDEKHPRPKDELDAPGLRKVMTERSDKQIQALEPTDAKSLAEYRRVVGTALRVMVGDSLPPASQLDLRQPMKESKLPSGVLVHKTVVGRKGEKDALPVIGVIPAGFSGTVTVWVHPEGKASLFNREGELVPEAKAILAKNVAILAPDVFQTGELKGDKPLPVDPGFAGYTFGYNRTLLGQRVHDVLTTIALAAGPINAKTIYLVGWEQAGPWAALASALSDGNVTRTAVDLNQFRFENVAQTTDEMMLPGAVKYGGLPAFASLCAPRELLLHNHKGTSTGKLTKSAYDLSEGKDKLTRSPEKWNGEKVVEWLVR
jgi:hypothetical protein